MAPLTDQGDLVRFGYTIVYVPDVPTALDFYARAFGLEVAFTHESGQYGELATGTTALAFASHVSVPHTPLDPEGPPAGFELSLVSDDVDGSFTQAVAAGARALTDPHDEPWGQRVAYVRDPFGTLVGIVSPMSA